MVLASPKMWGVGMGDRSQSPSRVSSSGLPVGSWAFLGWAWEERGRALAYRWPTAPQPRQAEPRRVPPALLGAQLGPWAESWTGGRPERGPQEASVSFSQGPGWGEDAE